MGQNPAVGSQHAGLHRRALAKLKWLVVRDLAEIETATFWRDSPGGAVGRAAPGGHRDRGLPDARRRARGEGGHASRTPSAWCSGATRRSSRRATRARSCGSCTTWPSGCKAHYAGSTRERDWPIVNLRWDYPEHGDTASPTSRPCCKEINGYDVATGRPRRRFTSCRATARPRAAAGSTPASSPTASTRPAAATRATSTKRGARVARVGVGLAGEPPHALQPRIRRPGRPAVEREKEVRVVGRGAGTMDRLRRARLPGRQAARLPRARPTRGNGRDQRGRPVHDDGRRARVAVRAERPARRPAADPLRAGRVAGAQPAVSADRCGPRGNPLAAAGEPAPRGRGSALPGRGDDLPAHRAAHRRRHEPQGAVARRAAARDVRRDRPCARRASAASTTAAG